MSEPRRPEDRTPDTEGAKAEGSAGEQGPINMDFYRSSRRPRPPTWPYVVSLIFMAAALILLVIFQDRCGELVSDHLFSGQR